MSNQRYGLTAKENTTLDFLQFYLSGSDGRIGPTYEEVMVAIECKSKSDVSRLLNSLERKGWIERMPNKARAISLVHHTCPHCGVRK